MRHLLFFFIGLSTGMVHAAFSPAEIASCQKFWNSFESEKVKSFETRCAPVAHLNWKTRKENGFEALLTAISFTPSGKEALLKIIPLCEEKKLHFYSSRSIEAERFKVSPETAGQYLKSSIYLDLEVPFVAAVVALFHEAIHAIDHLIEFKNFEKLSSDFQIIAMEHRAYRLQDQILTELISVNSDLHPVIDSAVDHRFIIGFPVSDAQFRKIMTQGHRISSETFDAYSTSFLSASSSLQRE